MPVLVNGLGCCPIPLNVHLLGEVGVKLAGSEESELEDNVSVVFMALCICVLSYQSQSVKSIGVSSLLQHGSQLVNVGILLWSGVSRVSWLVIGRDGRKVVIVVLGVLLYSGRHDEGCLVCSIEREVKAKSR